MPFALIACVVVLLLMGWGMYLLWQMRQRAELLREARVSSERHPLGSGEVDVDSSLLFRSPPSVGDEAYWMVFDTETFDLIPDEEPREDYDARPIALSWQLLDRSGAMLLEESHLIARMGALSPEATALHGVTDEALQQEGEMPRAVYELFLRDLSRASVVVAHHLSFHRSILARDLQQEELDGSTLLSARGLCTMEWGRELGFKRDSSGQARYPRLTELFGYLYFARPSLKVRYTSKTLRDVRLCAAVLRRHPSLMV